MITLLRKTVLTGIFFISTVGSALAEDVLMPFVLAYKTSGDVSAVASEVSGKLTGAGFEVAGEYSPYADAHVIVVTNDAMKAHAAKSEFGAYGAIEVTYTNPVYMAAAYRMAGDMADIRAQLEGALGADMDFGSEKELTAKKLRKFHYTVMMEYFDDPSELAEYDSQAEAVKAVEAGLAAGKGATSKVYRIDIPGKDETVFGVALKGADADDCSGDGFVMNRVDKSTPRGTAHLPYEIVVSDGTAYALYARFRIAINYPHLPMVAAPEGQGTFFKIMCSPGAIEEALTLAAGGEL
jgi:hypothetical protein